MANYYPNKDADFIAWLASYIFIKARKGSETSEPSNVAVVYAAGPPVPPVV